MNKHGACLRERSVYWGNALITVLTSKDRVVTSVLQGAWKDLVKGSMDYERESPKKAWAWWAMGFTEAYGILVLMNIKGKA